MLKIAIIYYSSTNNTEKMAHLVKEGINDNKIEVICERVENVSLDILMESHGVIIGSPTYFGSMSSQIKDFLDKSIKYYDKLVGKVGGAFTSCKTGGGETTLLSIINAMFIHGMVVQGYCKGNHYGPIAIGAPEEVARAECMKLGYTVSSLAKKLFN
jgi:NAD(P)H dehydrogenase (quinone)